MMEIYENSAEAMLAEHERLSSLYLYNSEMGEKRASLYLTLISASTAVLFGLAQFRPDVRYLVWSGIGLVAGMLVVGLVTFQRLVERRIRATEFLRAINRIHRYFVQKDRELELFYFWPPCDDVPTFVGKRMPLSGLRDLIAVMNGLFAGVLVAGFEFALWPGLGYVVVVPSAVGVGIIAWFLHGRYETWSCKKAAREGVRHVRFPHEKV
jgi:hypothetical protein